jgi:hypothetical protein
MASGYYDKYANANLFISNNANPWLISPYTPNSSLFSVAQDAYTISVDVIRSFTTGKTIAVKSSMDIQSPNLLSIGGNTVFTDRIYSSSSTTGPLVQASGSGAAGIVEAKIGGTTQLYVDATGVNVPGTLTAGLLSVTTLSVTTLNATNVNTTNTNTTNLTATGTSQLQGGVTVTGTTTMNGNADVQGTLTTDTLDSYTAGGTITINANATISPGNTFTTQGTVQLQNGVTVTGTTTMNGNADVQGTLTTNTLDSYTTGGTITINANTTISAGNTFTTQGTAQLQNGATVTGATLTANTNGISTNRIDFTTQSKTQSGYMNFGGLTYEWGRTAYAGASTTITFATAFTNTPVFTATLESTNTSVNNIHSIITTSVTTTQAVVQCLYKDVSVAPAAPLNDAGTLSWTVIGTVV